MLTFRWQRNSPLNCICIACIVILLIAAAITRTFAIVMRCRSRMPLFAFAAKTTFAPAAASEVIVIAVLHILMPKFRAARWGCCVVHANISVADSVMVGHDKHAGGAGRAAFVPS